MAQPSSRKDHSAFLAELAAALHESKARPGASAEERGRHARWLEHAQALSELFGGDERSTAAGNIGAELALPPALLKELSPRKRDQLEHQIVAVLAASNGRADLDQVLIGLYRGFGVIAKRRVIQNKLWRLVRTGRIQKAKNTRNVFALNASRDHRGKRKR